jgi:hypothetical protein
LATTSFPYLPEFSKPFGVHRQSVPKISRPAEGGVTRGGATGAGDVALVGDARLVSYATKPLPAVADDSGSGREAGA